MLWQAKIYTVGAINPCNDAAANAHSHYLYLPSIVTSSVGSNDKATAKRLRLLNCFSFVNTSTHSGTVNANRSKCQDFAARLFGPVGGLGGLTVRTLDLWSKRRDFDCQSGHYQVVTTWMGDCLQTGEPSWYISNTKVNSAFHLSGVGKSSAGLSGWG